MPRGRKKRVRPDFKPDPANALLPCCMTCTRFRPVPGSGPVPCEIMFVGEGPAYHEDRQLEPFVGPTGEELRGLYLPSAGLRPSQVYLTNVRKCWDKRNPKDAQAIDCGMFHLPEEVSQVQPSIVVLMGAKSCLTAKHLGLDLELHHGRPFGPVRWMGREVTLFPTYHPAGGLHDGNAMRPILSDFKALGQFLKGRLVLPQFKAKKHYQDLSDRPDLVADITTACKFICIDTELDGLDSNRDPLYSLQWSVTPWNAYLIRWNAREALWALHRAINQWQPLVSFHNGPFDIPACRRMSCWEDSWDWRDTMVRCHVLGYPQALKTLGYRLFGVQMRSYDDLVKPHADRAMIAYLSKALTLEYEKIPGRPGAPARIRSILRAYEKPHQDTDLFARWDKLQPWMQEIIEEQAGPAPKAVISLCPHDEIVQYGCEDAAVGLMVDEYTHKKGAEVYGQPSI